MKYIIALTLLISLHHTCAAQVDIPFAFTSDEDNRLLKDGEAGKSYVASGDTTNVVYLNEETFVYKLYNNTHKLITEGSYSNEGDRYYHEGKWTVYYDNGKPKMTGHYKKNKPIGLWQEFYENGKPKTTYNYAPISYEGYNFSCMAGGYEEFYDNGKLKITGIYGANLESNCMDTVSAVNPVSGMEEMKVVKTKCPLPVKIGTWEYYKESGELDRKEDF